MKSKLQAWLQAIKQGDAGESERFVEAAYRAVFRRASDDGGRATYLALLRQRRSPSRVLDALMDSEEFRSSRLVTGAHDTALVGALYRLLLEREPAAAELDAQVRALQAHGKPEELLASILESEERRRLLPRLDPRHAAANTAKGARDERPKLTIVQTCDPVKYLPMLQQSSRTVLEYARRHALPVQVFIGHKIGCHPWHAALNRVFLLNEYLDRGYDGWILYLDADAFIRDLAFDFVGYLAGKSRFAFVMAKAHAGSECPYWDVNSGVFFANLGHPACAHVLRNWKKFYETNYTDADFAAAAQWHAITSDQTALQGIFRSDPAYEALIDTSEGRSLFNSAESSVIRHVLRHVDRHSDEGSFRRRVVVITKAVREALENQRPVPS